MQRFLALFFCILRSKKIFSIDKKKYVIFDCVNSDILSKILPKDQTYVLSARSSKINTILINFKTIIFFLKNIFLRSIQLNYFISYLKQIDPKYVITTIDNSLNFSILTKYFENKIKFIAIQNATRGDFYENTSGYNKLLYFTNYIGMSDFDHDLMKKKNIVVKNFIALGSLRNSFYKNFKYPKINSKKKNYDICLISKHIFRNGLPINDSHSNAIFKIIKFLARYIKKNKKTIIIQSKSKEGNLVEKKFYEQAFLNTNYKIRWKDNTNHNSYESIAFSSLVVGAPSTLLREASIYPNVKIICFNSEKKEKKNPFSETNHIDELTYEKFEKKLNFYNDLGQADYAQKTNTDIDYIMKKDDTVKNFLSLLEKENTNLI